MCTVYAQPHWAFVLDFMDIAVLIKASNQDIHPVVKFDDYLPVDLSKHNNALEKVDLNDEEAFSSFIFNQLNEHGKQVGIGGYGEERNLYSRSDLFEGEEPRTIHLGIDVWSKAGTPVFCPVDGVVHSFANRAVHGDYGPVIILKHAVQGITFHTLYGHLSITALEGLEVGKKFKSGEQLATMGSYSENFHWPPHLHFQLIDNMEGYTGDYPGVCRTSEKSQFLSNCPDPAVFIF